MRIDESKFCFFISYLKKERKNLSAMQLDTEENKTIDTLFLVYTPIWNTIYGSKCSVEPLFSDKKFHTFSAK